MTIFFILALTSVLLPSTTTIGCGYVGITTIKRHCRRFADDALKPCFKQSLNEHNHEVTSLPQNQKYYFLSVWLVVWTFVFVSHQN